MHISREFFQHFSRIPVLGKIEDIDICANGCSAIQQQLLWICWHFLRKDWSNFWHQKSQKDSRSSSCQDMPISRGLIYRYCKYSHDEGKKWIFEQIPIREKKIKVKQNIHFWNYSQEKNISSEKTFEEFAVKISRSYLPHESMNLEIPYFFITKYIYKISLN